MKESKKSKASTISNKNGRGSKNNKASQPKTKNGSKILKVISKSMPYILTISSVVVLFSLIGLLGGLGTVIKNVCYGLFSNFATYFIPLFMLYHAIMWYYDTKRKICFRRIICSLFAIFGMSTLQHIITTTVDTELAVVRNMGELYSKGMNGQGGGVSGGLFTRALTSIGGNVVAIIIVFVVLTLMLLQMFNITPLYMIRAISSKNKKKKPKPTPVTPTSAKNKGKVKHKSVDIFDDEDDFDATMSDFELSSTEEININNDDSAETSHVTSITHQNDHSDQLEPYDATKDYSAKSTSTNTDNTVNELLVTKTKLGNDNELNKSIEASNDDTDNDTEAESNKMSSTGLINFNSYIDDIEDESELTNDIENEEVSVEIIDEENVVIENVEDNIEASIDDEEAYGEEELSIEELQDEDADSTPYSNYDYNEENEAQSIEEEQEEVLFVLPSKAPHATSNEDKKYMQSQNADFIVTAKEKNEAPSFKAERKEEKMEEKKMEQPKPKKPHKFPPLDFLKSKSQDENEEEIREELDENANKIVSTLNDFGVRTRIVDVARGPTVTRYEIAPEAGVRVKSIANLADDIALNLAAEGIRIESPIPGKSAVGIEVPNKTTSIVYLKDLLAKDKFQNAKAVLTCAIGKSISGEDIYVDIEKTPHLLVAGATGMGKSVCINSLLISLLYKASPDDLRLILVDPKRVELSNYNGIPHLLVPVVCEPKKSLGALQWAVTEMEKRFEDIEKAGVRNLTEFNEKVDEGYEAEKMSRIVIVIDELADLKMAVPDIEGHITRLTQKARAAGIHIIIGTQRPSVDVITGLIKNNIPSRIAFRVPSQVDSRTILDEQGAEKLVSRGDMLVKIVGALKPVRVQGAFVSASEIESVINFLKANGEANYDESVMQQIDSNAAKLAKAEKKDDDEDNGHDDDLDAVFYDALRLAAEEGKISSSQLQRKLRLGFQRAARIIDQMYDMGYIGEPNGSKPRDVLITLDDYREIMMRREDDEE